MLYSATSVTAGRAKAVECAIGMDTEMGKIAGFIMEETDEQTPLQKKLASLGKTLGLAALAICAAIFAIGVAKHLEPLDMFITAVSLAVAAIPEGLPATVTVMLAIGVERMARKNAIVKKAFRSRNARRGKRNLHRQNRHAHRKPNEGIRGIFRGRSLHRRNRRSCL